MHKKSAIIGLTKDFRKIIKTYGVKYKKTVLKHLRFMLTLDGKDAYNENEDDIEYLRDIIDRLSKLKKHYLKQNKYHDHNIKYHGIETIKYLFNDEDEDYNLYLIDNQQYQSFFGKILLKFNEHLEKIRPELIKIIKNCKINLTVNIIFRSIKSFNDKRNLCIKSKITTDIDDIEPEGVESIIHNFTEVITTSTYIESPEWLKLKRCIMNPQNNDNRFFQYSITLSLYHQQISKNFFRISKITPYINNLN